MMHLSGRRTFMLTATVVLLVTMAGPAAAQIQSGSYEVVPGTVVRLQGGIAGETRVNGIFGRIEIIVDRSHATAYIGASDLRLRDYGWQSWPFPADDLLALRGLSGTVVSPTEIRFTSTESYEAAFELVFSENESGLLLNGSYAEPCCDRFFYSLVDIALTPVSAGGIYLPGIASTRGLHATSWQSDVEIFNPSAGTMRVTITYISDGGRELDPSWSFNLDWGASETFRDVVGFLATPGFPTTDSKGYLHITTDRGLPIVSASTYNLADNAINSSNEGTYGQALFPFTIEDCIGAGERAFLIGLCGSANPDTGQRSNIGLLNISTTGQATVRVIRDIPPDKSGVLSRSRTYTLEPGQLIQRNVFQDLDLADRDMCTPLRIEVDAGGPVAAYGSRIDNQTQDPILVVAQLAK